mgnify:CR=1 FL=1
MERELDRRKFLALSGAAGVAAIAGCSGGSDDGGTTTEPSDTPSSAPMPSSCEAVLQANVPS